ncbi:hypothetical protein WA026_013334 [Henosepilachna vigintioctopunctata]|uniref:FP protein C-terminal domain-containing protein n=1 Tax=Henosepilachna vigintioctopunctata TaxID=420089 RepID=A0AAW1V5N2_9CUCU
MNFNGGILTDLQKTINDIKHENKLLKKGNERLMKRVTDVETYIAKMKSDKSKEQNLERQNNVVIMGLRSDDAISSKNNVLKICEKLGMQIQQDEFECKNKKEKGILNLKECNIEDRRGNIYINDDLPRDIRTLLLNTKKLKEYGYKYVWCKDGQLEGYKMWFNFGDINKCDGTVVYIRKRYNSRCEIVNVGPIKAIVLEIIIIKMAWTLCVKG